VRTEANKNMFFDFIDKDLKRLAYQKRLGKFFLWAAPSSMT
jgi:hypothetical protein